jgi:hypothetical protein
MLPVEPGQTFGAWTAIGADPSDKRILCRCSCSTVRLIAREALENGETKGCGCRATPKAARTGRTAQERMAEVLQAGTTSLLFVAR